MTDLLKRLAVQEDGATMFEYVLLAACVGAVMVMVVTSLGSVVGGLFASVSPGFAGGGS
jgi:Flp pilus assembly pilin Flp